MDGNAPPEDLHVERIGPERIRIPDHEAVDRLGRYPVPAQDLDPEKRKVGAVAHPAGEGGVETHWKEAGSTVDTGVRRPFHPGKEDVGGGFRIADLRRF